MACIAPHSTPRHPPHSPPTTTGLCIGGPVVLPRRREPHGGVEPGRQTPVAIYDNTHLAPPRPCRNRNLLQHARTRQNRQACTPLLSAPPLLPHTRTPNTNPHMPRPKPGHGLHPPLHLLLSQARTTRARTHSHAPPREAHHLQGNRGVRHPHPAAQNPVGPRHHGPRHIRLPAHEPMPAPTTITGGPTLLHRRLRRVHHCAHHQGGPPCN